MHLEVIDESHMHSVPEGAESHFKVVAVSERFADHKLVGRHRMVNRRTERGIRRRIARPRPAHMDAGGMVREGRHGARIASQCMGGSKAEN